ncbi:unnamed protein product [Triticum turgidum subsp. durum]|uniref:Uncharacterized protein n=1 Tax=Triticum turgidum subsp. durum TaxID=4567 RepID=A0A9R1RFR3_TRITD|nr:unnamed protein product [Triticum turgidum subsp. durum]
MEETSRTAGAASRFVQDTAVFVVIVLVTVCDRHMLTVCEDGNANSKDIRTIIWVRGKYTAMMMTMFPVHDEDDDGCSQF